MAPPQLSSQGVGKSGLTFEAWSRNDWWGWPWTTVRLQWCKRDQVSVSSGFVLLIRYADSARASVQAFSDSFASTETGLRSQQSAIPSSSPNAPTSQIARVGHPQCWGWRRCGQALFEGGREGCLLRMNVTFRSIEGKSSFDNLKMVAPQKHEAPRTSPMPFVLIRLHLGCPGRSWASKIAADPEVLWVEVKDLSGF